MQIRTFTDLSTALSTLTFQALQQGVFIYGDFGNVSHLHLDSLNHPQLGWCLALRSIKVHIPFQGTAQQLLRHLQTSPVPLVIDDIVSTEFDRQLVRHGYLPCDYASPASESPLIHARYWPASVSTSPSTAP